MPLAVLAVTLTVAGNWAPSPDDGGPAGGGDRLIAPLLGYRPEDITAGKMTYDLRRLRAHGLIERIPHTRRYQITDAGVRDALFFTHAHDHLLRTGLAELTDPSPPLPSPLRAATRAYQAAFNDLASHAHLAA